MFSMTGYYHEFMLQGCPHLCQYMPKRKDARRQVPDPANEPNFYAIADRFPLDVIPEETPSAAELQGPETTSVTEDKAQVSFAPMAHNEFPNVRGKPAITPARSSHPVASVASFSPMSVEALLEEILVSNNGVQARVPLAPTTRSPASDLAALLNAIHQAQQTQLLDAVTSLAAQIAQDKKQQEISTNLALALSLLGN